MTDPQDTDSDTAEIPQESPNPGDTSKPVDAEAPLDVASSDSTTGDEECSLEEKIASFPPTVRDTAKLMGMDAFGKQPANSWRLMIHAMRAIDQLNNEYSLPTPEMYYLMKEFLYGEDEMMMRLADSLINYICVALNRTLRVVEWDCHRIFMWNAVSHFREVLVRTETDVPDFDKFLRDVFQYILPAYPLREVSLVGCGRSKKNRKSDIHKIPDAVVLPPLPPRVFRKQGEKACISYSQAVSYKSKEPLRLPPLSIPLPPYCTPLPIPPHRRVLPPDPPLTPPSTPIPPFLSLSSDAPPLADHIEGPYQQLLADMYRNLEYHDTQSFEKSTEENMFDEEEEEEESLVDVEDLDEAETVDYEEGEEKRDETVNQAVDMNFVKKIRLMERKRAREELWRKKMRRRAEEKKMEREMERHLAMVEKGILDAESARRKNECSRTMAIGERFVNSPKKRKGNKKNTRINPNEREKMIDVVSISPSPPVTPSPFRRVVGFAVPVTKIVTPNVRTVVNSMSGVNATNDTVPAPANPTGIAFIPPPQFSWKRRKIEESDLLLCKRPFMIGGKGENADTMGRNTITPIKRINLLGMIRQNPSTVLSTVVPSDVPEPAAYEECI